MDAAEPASRAHIVHAVVGRDTLSRQGCLSPERAMVAQTEQAFLALAPGHAPKEPTVNSQEYKDMEPF